MKVLISSSVFSPHLYPLELCINKKLGNEGFLFAANQSLPTWRKNMGWQDGTQDCDWRISADKGDPRVERAWNHSDVVICCQRDVPRIRRRVLRGKLTFTMSERWFRPPISKLRLLWPPFLKMMVSMLYIRSSPYFQHLAIGPKAATDLRSVLGSHSNIFTWAYFTNLKARCQSRQRFGGGRFDVYYVGRLVRLKRVHLVMRAVQLAKLRVPGVHLNIVGSGPEEVGLKKYAVELGLRNDVTFHGVLSQELVGKHLSNARLVVLASGAREGWGAIVSEAMAIGVPVCASAEGGAAGALIKNSVNGFLFTSDDFSRIAEVIQALSSDSELDARICKAAIFTADEWSPEVAAKRLINYCDNFLSGKPVCEYRVGPMSRVL